MLRRPCHAVPCSRRDGWNRNGGCIVVDGGWIVGGACSRGWSAAAISKSDHTQTSPSLSALSVCTHCSLPFALALHLTSHRLLLLYCIPLQTIRPRRAYIFAVAHFTPPLANLAAISAPANRAATPPVASSPAPPERNDQPAVNTLNNASRIPSSTLASPRRRQRLVSARYSSTCKHPAAPPSLTRRRPGRL